EDESFKLDMDKVVKEGNTGTAAHAGNFTDEPNAGTYTSTGLNVSTGPNASTWIEITSNATPSMSFIPTGHVKKGARENRGGDYEDIMTGMTTIKRKAAMDVIEAVWKKLLADVTCTFNKSKGVSTDLPTNDLQV
ncbi:hypothetical protein Tco_0171370, partial [Tanacetum coccineum]